MNILFITYPSEDFRSYQMVIQVTPVILAIEPGMV